MHVIVERPALERRVSASLEAGRIPVVLGNCGSGRTSLLLRLEGVLGRSTTQYVDLAAAASTPERCLRVVLASSHLPASAGLDVSSPTPRAAFDGLLRYLGGASVAESPAATFLIDEFLDVKTFESFPGLRHVQRELVDYLAKSPVRYVLASRFTSRVHRLLRDASARFEVIHVAPLDVDEVQAMALRFDGGRRDWAASIAGPVAALTGGRASAVNLLLGWLASTGPATDPVAGLAALFSPDAALTARYRECYEFRLHRARGYGALKAILGVLAESEPLNLTEVSQHLQRTPGSTKDYLSWLEDVDLITSQGKRYTFEDPLLRLYVRLYGRAVPPSDDEIVREVGAYAKARLPQPARQPAPVPSEVVGDTVRSGIIEID
jgi:energy-coupling factor transporter ATP-binding protein EcfA2